MIVFGLVLSLSQAETVAGMYSNNHLIDPVPLTNGNYFLPLECLNNPNYPLEVRQYLASFSISEVDYELFFNPQ